MDGSTNRYGQSFLQKIWDFFLVDKVFTISFILAILSVVFGHFTTRFFDYKVIVTVFGLMFVIQGFQSTGLLTSLGQTLAKRSHTTRQLVRFTTLLAFFCAIIFTNDVAILTILPIYLGITRNIKNRRSVLLGASFILPAVHFGSLLFPSGNPHNLYLYSFYQISNLEFFKNTGLLFIAGFILLNLACQFIDNSPFVIETQVDGFKKKDSVVFALLMILMVIAVLGKFSFQYFYIVVTLLVAIIIGVFRPKLFKHVDYHLLLTFICFFIIVGNIASIHTITNFIGSFFTGTVQSYVGTILVSQMISNIPAAVLISPFTRHSMAVVLGADIGGIGTIVASMATLITYRMIRVQNRKEAHQFSRIFFLSNFCFLVVAGAIGLFILLTGI